MAVIGMIFTLIAIGLSIPGALVDYEKAAKIYKATVYMQIDNCFKLSLAKPMSWTNKGKTTRRPDIIAPGVREAQNIQQDTALEGVEMLGSYSLVGGYEVLYYCSVKQKVVGRASNKMGLCIRKERLSDKPTEEWFSEIKEKPGGCLGIHEFDEGHFNLQCCLDGICVQGSITPGNHANMTIRLIPTSFDDFATKEMKQIVQGSQPELDHYLDNDQTCFSTVNDNNDVGLSPSITVIIVCSISACFGVGIFVGIGFWIRRCKRGY